MSYAPKKASEVPLGPEEDWGHLQMSITLMSTTGLFAFHGFSYHFVVQSDGSLWAALC